MYTIPGAKKKMAEANPADIEGQQSLLQTIPAPRPKVVVEKPLAVTPVVVTSSATSTNFNGEAELKQLRDEMKEVKNELQQLLSLLGKSERLFA